MNYLYLLATLLFVFGIKRLTSVKTCASGNRLSELGMAVAVVTTVLIYREDINWVTIAAGVVAGGGIGLLLAKKTPTTQMPELVAALNGFGGISSALVAMAEVLKGLGEGSIWDGGALPTVATIAAVLIGMLTLTGSFVAYGKLSGKSLNHPLSGAARHGLLDVGRAVALGPADREEQVARAHLRGVERQAVHREVPPTRHLPRLQAVAEFSQTHEALSGREPGRECQISHEPP